MTNDTNDIDIINNEGTEPVEVEETDTNSVDWEAKAKELEGRLKRAETKLKKSSDTPHSSPSTGEFDYGQKAFLKASGFESPDEIKLVQDFIKNTGKTLDEAVSSKYLMAEIKEMRELKNTESAVPSGSKRVTQNTVDTVDYWLAKDEMPPKENTALRREWVNAKMKKEQNSGKFYNS